MLEVMIDNKNGNIWDIADLVSNVTWKTSRIGKAGSLDFTFVKGGLYQNEDFHIENGDIVRVRKDGMNVFYGYVFKIDSGQDEDVKVTAYDQLRYLLFNDTLIFSARTATEIVQMIARKYNLKTGQLDESAYVIPTMAEDNTKLMDMICKALDLTLISTGRIYVLFDDFGQVALRDVTTMLLDFSLGEGGLMTDYSFSRSIDNETYNRIELVRAGKDPEDRVRGLEDPGNIAKWGRLQLHQKVDDGLNEAQINERLSNLLKLKNREQKTLSIEEIGNVRVRAGCLAPVFIESLGLSQFMLVEECVHKFDGDDHTMSLEMKVF
nr:hypothetical protein [Paenibacillus periandrae]